MIHVSESTVCLLELLASLDIKSALDSEMITHTGTSMYLDLFLNRRILKC